MLHYVVRRKRLWLPACLLALLSSSSTIVFADIYRYVEPDGTISFTNVPTDARYQRIVRESRRSQRLGLHDLEPTIARHSRQHGLHPALVRAVIKAESDFNPMAVSRAGAVGLMQLMPETARLLGVDPLDPDQNIDGGTRFLAGLLALFEGNLDAAIVGYVGGPAYARTWLRGHLVPSADVLAYLRNVKTSYREGGRP
jgi:soluble lytic murein transglycosylase